MIPCRLISMYTNDGRRLSTNPFMEEVHEFDHEFWDKAIEDYA